MRDSDFEKFGVAWVDCWSMYGKQATPGVINMAFETLKRYELTDVTAAMTRHMNDPDAGQFFPKPADIVRNLEGTKSSQGMVAWSKVERAIRRVGCGESVVFDDRIIHAVIDDMGGWIAMGKFTEDELPFRAREFEKRYQAYVLAPPLSFPRRLIGEHESYNDRHGFKVAPPVLVGDRQKAALVHQSGSDGGQHEFTRLNGPVTQVLASLTDNRDQGRA